MASIQRLLWSPDTDVANLVLIESQMGALCNFATALDHDAIDVGEAYFNGGNEICGMCSSVCLMRHSV